MTNLPCECQELKPKGETNSSFLVLHPLSGVHTVKTVGSHLKRNPPSLCYVGETVLVRVAKTKKPVKGKKTALRGTCEGLIFKADHDLPRYYVVFEDPNTAKQQKIWVKVDDITSLTKDEEKRRQDTAKKQNNKRKRLSPDNCTSTPTNSKHVKLTNDVNVLDVSIWFCLLKN